MRSITLLPPLTAALLIAVAACDSSAPADQAPGTPGRASTTDATAATDAAPSVVPPAGPLAEVAWHTERVNPVSTPEVIGGTLVLYTLQQESLEITGVDPATGRVRWSHPATPSQSVGGVTLTVHEVDGAVVHLAPVAGDFHGEAPARIMLRDPRSGEALRTSRDPLSHGRLPSACDSDPDRVCAQVRVDGEWTELGLTRDGLLLEVPESAATGWAEIGPLGLSRTGREGTELARVVDGVVLWEASTEDLFAPDHSTNSGWQIQAFAEDSLLVGSVGTRLRAPSYRTEWDLPAYRTVGIDAATGERTWLAEHTSAFCDTDVTGQPTDPLLACVWHSGTRVTVQGDSTFSDLDVDLVRLDPVTGDARWTVELDEPVWEDGQVPPVLRPMDGRHLSVDTVGGPVVIDVETGESRPGRPGDVTWVEQDPYHQVAVPGSGEALSTVTGTGRFVPRDAAGERAATVPWPLPPGVRTDVPDTGLLVVADRRGLTAYRAP